MKKQTSISQPLLDQADISDTIAFICNKNTKFVHFNKAWQDYRAASLEEDCNADPHDFLHPDDAAAFLKNLAGAGLHKEPFLTECRVRAQDGSYGWFRFIVRPVFSPKGLYSASIAHGQDIRERKLVAENARRFSAVITSVETGIIIKDREDRITEWSAGAENIMGYCRDEVLGKTADIYTHRPNLQAIAKVNALLHEGKHTSFIRTEVTHKDGHLIICSTSFSPIFGADGGVSGSVVIFHDVTAEKMAEQKRLEAEEELQRTHKDTAAILAEIPAPVCVVSESEGTILGCNAAFAAMCAASESSMLQTPMTRYFQSGGDSHGDSAQHFINRLQSNENFVCRMKKFDGTYTNVEIMGRPLHYHDQHAFAVHCLDLSQREKHEQALREAVLAAEEASKMKSSFLANMSHEIRTPLNGVIGFAELALDEQNLSSAVQNYLHKIKLSAHGLLEIINDVLDISKIEAGKIDLEKAPFDLHDDILQSCEATIGIKAKEKNVILYLYAEPLVDKKFVGDQMRLRQILLNLLSNAVKFTNVGIVKLMLSVEKINEDQSTVSFEVKDSGIGMTPDQIQKIFDPFTQADSSTTRKYGGTGLGLAITRNLIEIMGGKLEVESAVGIGSKFSFSLTFETIVDNSKTSRPSALPQGQREKPLFAGEVLVCEDNTINQQVIQEHLAKVGIAAVVMPNGKLGVDEVKKRLQSGKPFDLILMDIHMPVMDGLEATQKLHELGVTTPIIALTANAMTTDKKKYLSHGMSDYLAKPFKTYELWDCLLRHLTPVGVERPESADAAPASLPLPHQLPQLPQIPLSDKPTVHKDQETAQGPATAEPEAEDKAPLSEAPAPIIDRELGIENSAGNPALYQRLLTNFWEDNRDAQKKLHEALAGGNLVLAHRMAHTLKSVAGTIGAMALSQWACELELALNDKNMESVHRSLPNFTAALESVLQELALTESKAESLPSAQVLDKNKALELVDKLAPLLREADSESLEYLEAIASTIGPVGDMGQQLADQIADYDFELALATLNDIKARLEA